MAECNRNRKGFSCFIFFLVRFCFGYFCGLETLEIQYVLQISMVDYIPRGSTGVNFIYCSVQFHIFVHDASAFCLKF